MALPPALARPLWLLAIGGFVSGTSIRIAEPLLPKLSAEFGVSAAAAAGVITSFALAYGLFQLVHGPLGDRLGKLRTTAGALLLAGVASIFCAGAESLEALSLWRFLAGMTAGAVIPLSFAYIGDNIPFETRQAVLGRFIGGILIGQTTGPLLGGITSDWIGWRYAFGLPGIAFVAIGAALAWSARGERVQASTDVGVLRVYALLLRTPLVRAMCLFVAVESFLFHGTFAYLGVFMRDSFAISYTLIGVLLAGFGLGGFAYSLSVGPLVTRLGQARMVLLGGVLLLLAFVGLAWTPLVVLVAPLTIVVGYGFYLLHNTMQTFATEMAPGARGAGVALFAFALFLSQAVGVIASGRLIEAVGYAPQFLLTGVGLLVLACVFAAWLARRAR